MSRAPKRRRQLTTNILPSRRPIDKSLIVVNQVATTTVNVTQLKSTTFPCTVVGLRWSVTSLALAVSGNSNTAWAIIVVRDGESTNAPSLANAAKFYTPEQNVLAFGMFHSRDADAAVGGPLTQTFEGSTKTMRKLNAGDVLQFISFSDRVAACDMNGIIQFFCKS